MNDKNKLRSKKYSSELISIVWEKAQIIKGFDPDEIRKDACGALIKRELFRKNNFPLSMSWDINFIQKKTINNKSEDYNNLQPLQWENHKNKMLDSLAWKCCVTSKGEKNRYVNK